jgi:hypothetical protein
MKILQDMLQLHSRVQRDTAARFEVEKMIHSCGSARNHLPSIICTTQLREPVFSVLMRWVLGGSELG